jgi:hypothetical protein
MQYPNSTLSDYRPFVSLKQSRLRKRLCNRNGSRIISHSDVSLEDPEGSRIYSRPQHSRAILNLAYLNDLEY